MATPEEQERATLTELAKSVEKEARSHGRDHAWQSGIWRFMNYAIGVPSILLAALAGGSIADDWDKTYSALLALAAAIFSRLLTFLTPSALAAGHHEAELAYQKIRIRAEHLLALAPGLKMGELETKVDRLEQDRVDVTVPHLPPLYRWLARRFGGATE
jgi:hypothetical protein